VSAISTFSPVARLDSGVPAHGALRLNVDYRRRQKANGQLEKTAGRPRNVWLNKVQEDADAIPLSTLWRSEIAIGHGPLGLRDDNDEDSFSFYVLTLTLNTSCIQGPHILISAVAAADRM